MKSFRKLLFLFLVIPMTVQAENTQVILNRTVELDFEPKDAFFLLDNGSEITKVPVQFALTEQPKKTFVSSLLLQDQGNEIKQAFIVSGTNGEFRFFDFAEQSLTANVEILKKELDKLKENLESWKVQLRVQGESLERLRSDATYIGNLGRIAEKTTELERVNNQIKHLKDDIENLNRFIALVGKTPQPRNFTRRQTTLTEQLGEIAQAAKLLEASERGRKAQGETDLQQDIHLVEMARDEDYDSLRLSLKNLRQIRSELEDSFMRE